MNVISGSIALSSTSSLVTPNNPNDLGVHPSGTKVTTYSPTEVFESGITKYRLNAFDLSKNFGEVGRTLSFYSAIRDSNHCHGTAGSSVAITYRTAPYSGATYCVASTKLRISGTSVSGATCSAGADYTVISSPNIGPFMQLEFHMLQNHVTSGMNVDYAIVSE